MNQEPSCDHRNPFLWGLLVAFLLFYMIAAQAAVNVSEESLSSLKRPTPATAMGESVTLLPDGRWLLLGGMKNGRPVRTASLIDDVSGKRTVVAARMTHVRAWHSATVLPNGKVFVFGGIDPSGGDIANPEIFDPTTLSFSSLTDVGTPRSHHTANLSLDGKVVLLGGLFSQEAELWDSAKSLFTPSQGQLKTPRAGHSTIPTPISPLLIWGGITPDGVKIFKPEVYLPERDSFSPLETAGIPPLDSLLGVGLPRVMASIPSDRAQSVKVDSQIAIRFSKFLRVRSVTLASITLHDDDLGRAVVSRVVAAEDGLLAFLRPRHSLRPNAHYTVNIEGVTDELGIWMPSTVIRFSTQTVDDSSTEKTPSSLRFDSVAPARSAPSPASRAAATALGVTNPDVWIPALSGPAGSWETGYAAPALEKLPSLAAPPGTTALSGQVFDLQGRPMANVTLRISQSVALSDATGRFLLRTNDTGRPLLVVDARLAGTSVSKYGVFLSRVKVKNGVTNVLPTSIMLPALDVEHAIPLTVPTSAEVVATTPLIPGLEIHIPRGSILRDIDGKPITSFTITPLPTDRGPFPLYEGEKPKVFFTTQMGGTKIGRADGKRPQGIRIVYPNSFNRAPGSKVDLWSVDAAGVGWHVYGQGTVSANGKKVIPDPGAVVYGFSCFNGGNPNGHPGPGPVPNDPRDPRDPPGPEGGRDRCPSGCTTDGEPVDLATGLFNYDKTDLVLPDVVPIKLQRTYNAQDHRTRAFGIGVNHAYEIFIDNAVRGDFSVMYLVLPDGGKLRYNRTSPGTTEVGAVLEQNSAPGKYYKSVMSWNASRPGWDIALRDGSRYEFSVDYLAEVVSLIAVVDRNGNRVTITRAASDSNGGADLKPSNILRVSSPNGRGIEFTYDSYNRVIRAKDTAGRTVSYEYDGDGNLWKVTDAALGVTTYTYDSSHRMVTITDPRNIIYLTNEYDADGRIMKQTLADNGIFQFTYAEDGNGKVIQTEVINPRSIKRKVTFNSSGYILSDTAAVGKTEQQITTLTRNASNSFISAVVDPLNRKTAYTYDSFGNLTAITRLADTAQTVTTKFDYEPTFNQVSSIKDPLNRTTSLGYDGNGNLTSITDALSHIVARIAYNPAGQPVSVTDALDHTLNFGYLGGDLQSVTDALGRSATRFTDSIGRVITSTDSLNNTTRYDYDALTRLTGIIDPLGNSVSLAYDADNNLIRLTDPRAGVTEYGYDNKNNLATRKDPLLKTESYAYDKNDNLISYTDRKTQVSQFGYDALDRRSLSAFNAGIVNCINSGCPSAESTVSYSYDAGDRLIQLVDSGSGSLTRQYDGLNRLTQEITPKGTVASGYDKASRRTSSQITGQTGLTYGYDLANHLKTITQGTAVVNFSYDLADRRSKLTLPNGLQMVYGYDAANQLTSISYKNGTATLGDLTYGYDAAGRRISQSGSYAQTSLPPAVGSAAYDANNRLTSWGGSTLTYDDNGNLRSAGGLTYNWNSKDQLIGLSGTSTANFQYDAAGRRQQKTIAGTGTGFVYDGANVVQELAGSTASANLLTGLGIDEIFRRTDSAGARDLLTDALGSTIALTDGGGSVTTNYNYGAYGATTQTGTGSNPYQYTGRENDGTGLYYYRARYYNPGFGRFASEDPIGFGGGINTYAYALNRPTMLTDPTGLGPVLFLACSAANGAYQIHNFNSTARDLSQNTDLLRDQLDRVNDRINNCGPNDGEKKANLLQMRSDLARRITSGIGQSAGAGDSGHVDVAQGLIAEGACSLLLLVGP